ncbi:hypothetical protein B0H13DRAFT_2380070 [Mycena leptocephala]|nr:hypothetical protein B0H13DRAFT_2380070 [Mycena leptocephala]
MEIYSINAITIPNVNTTGKLGLLDGSLYDVLETSYVGSDAEVEAIGFNMTCGYLPAPLSVTWNQNDTWTFVFPSPFTTVLLPARAPGMIGQAMVRNSLRNTTISNSVTMYATLPILDSLLQNISPVNVDPPMTSIFDKGPVSLWFFQCSQTVVHQRATVQAQSRQATTLDTSIEKHESLWAPYGGPVPGDLNASMIDMWAVWLTSTPAMEFVVFNASSSDDYSTANIYFLTFSEIFLMYRLNLIADGPTLITGHAPRPIPMNLTLHDVENAISAMVASLFWTLGHQGPVSNLLALEDGLTDVPQTPPYLLEGDAIVYEYVTEIRLDISIVAVVIGMLASISLALLSLSICQDQPRLTVSLAGSGLLQTIWLFRRHPELEVLLPRVENPTDTNLRAAGMIPVRLIGPVGSEHDADDMDIIWSS